MGYGAIARPVPKISVFERHVVEMARQRGVSVDEAVKAVRKWGVEGADLWFSDEEKPDNERMLAGGLKAATLIVFMDLAHTNDITRTEAAIAYAKSVGSPRLMLVPGFVRKGEDRKAAWMRMRPNLTDFVRRAGRAGLTVDIEDFDASDVLIGSQEDLRRTFAAFPELGHVLDTGNYLFWTNDVLQAQREFTSRIRHVHVKDRAKDDMTRSVAAGTGIIPVKAILAGLQSANYNGWLTVECFGSTNMWDDVRRSAEYIAVSCSGMNVGGNRLAVPGRDGGLWPDDKGVHVNAHGGCILFHGDRYWWYGEHKIAGTAGNRAHGTAVHVYSSDDLEHWRDEGAALSCVDDPNADLTDGAVVERPKVLFCAKTGKFVMRFHLELKQFGPGYGAARTGVAVADRPQGPFRYLYGARLNAGWWPQNAEKSRCTLATVSRLAADGKPIHDLSGGPNKRSAAMDVFARDFVGGQMTRDQTLFVDDDGTAYQISASEDNSTLQIAELTADYLGCTGRYWRMAEKEWTEAPAVFKRNGWYYLIGSGCTGWEPNAARSYRARKITGPWESLGNPCRGVNSNNGLGPEKTWGGQSAFVFTVPGEHRQVAMFDLWCPTNAVDGRYVWREIEFEDGRPVVKWDVK